MKVYKFRIIKKGYKFYIQEKGWFFWNTYGEYAPELDVKLDISYNSLQDAKWQIERIVAEHQPTEIIEELNYEYINRIKTT